MCMITWVQFTDRKKIPVGATDANWGALTLSQTSPG